MTGVQTCALPIWPWPSGGALTVGVQTFVQISAGVTRMPLRLYLPAVAVGSVVWAKLNALNYKKNRIEIIFDEIVQVEKAFYNVIISPPQKQMPVVKALGKRIVVDLKDTIQENTTYTVFFGDAIVDNNEHNPLPNYTFSFSTGNTIDSLQISGTLKIGRAHV